MTSNFEDTTTIPQGTLQGAGPINKQTITEQSLTGIPPIIPTQQYGQAQDTLNAELALRNLSGGGKYYCSYTSRALIDGTGSQSITGVGFTPKMILIRAVYATSSGGSESNGQATNTSNEFVIYWYNQNGGYYTANSFESGRIIRLFDYNGNTSSAQLSSIDSDGFTLDWVGISFNVDFMFQCFG